MKVFDFYKEIQSIDLYLEGEGTDDLDKVKNNVYFLKDDDVETDKIEYNENEKVAYLSEQFLDFKNILYGQVHKRILFLYNNSDTSELEFEFEKQSLNILKNEKEFSISPSEGKLHPKEKIMIEFQLEQSRMPIFIEGEINCKIKWIDPNND